MEEFAKMSLTMKFAVVFLALVAVVLNVASEKIIGNLKEFSYESCSTVPEAIIINLVNLEPDPILFPGTVTFNLSVTSSVAVTSPTWSTFTLSYRADANSTWTDFHCVDKPVICGHPDVCTVLENIFPIDQPCPQSFVDNNVPCRCPFEATTYEIFDGSFQLTNSLEDLGLLAGDYRLKVVLNKDDVEIGCYSFYASAI